MTFELFGATYTFLAPGALWLLALVPVLWLPLLWRRYGWVVVGAGILRTLTAIAVIAALAGLSRQTLLSDNKLALVATIDASDSISAEGRAWIKEYVDRLFASLQPEDEVAALVFAANTHLELPPGAPTGVTLPADISTRVQSGGTNIARALERTFALYPEGADKRLLLLTDGNETNDAARRSISLARQMGVKIFPVIPPSGQQPEVSLEKFVVPPLVREGGVFSLRLVVRNGNNQPVQGTAQVLANDQRLTRQAITLEPGLSVLEIPAQILQRGNYLLRAEVEATPDTVAGNNRQNASLAVTGKTRALVITDNPRTHLARALQLKEVEIEFRQPEGLPTELADLLDYNCLVFDDIGRGGITSQQMAVIERYVRDFGGGFLMAGGVRTFGDLTYKDTAIERILPLTFQEQRPKRKQRIPLALYLLIDRSNSMGYNSKVRGLHDGQKMHYAQQAALAVLRQLEDTDLVGAIAFDSESYELAPLGPLAENRSRLKSRIERLRYGGGTDFYSALEKAADQISRSRRAIRHIILLTDGDTNRSPTDHFPLVATIAQRQISITTIRIGADTVNLQLLSYMSEKTGGRFYHAEDAKTLPQLLVKDTKRAIRERDRPDDRARDIIPRIGTRGQILRGLDNFPALEEHLLTKPKAGAQVQLYTDVYPEHDPLLATWQYGLGRVVAVPFDPSGGGASDWISWEGFGKFWSQAVRWAMRHETPWDYRLSIQQRSERTILRAESYGSDQEGILQARILQGSKNAELTLMPVAPRIYEATLPGKQRGSFPVTIVKRRGGKIVDQKTQTVMTSYTPGESLDEYRQQHPNRDLLRELAEGTGGVIDPDPNEIVAQKRVGQKILIHPLADYLIILALFLILPDVGLRVLRGPPISG